MKHLVGHFCRVDRRGGVVMYTCIKLCSGSIERETLQRKSRWLQTSIRPLVVLM